MSQESSDASDPKEFKQMIEAFKENVVTRKEDLRFPKMEMSFRESVSNPKAYVVEKRYVEEQTLLQKDKLKQFEVHIANLEDLLKALKDGKDGNGVMEDAMKILEAAELIDLTFEPKQIPQKPQSSNPSEKDFEDFKAFFMGYDVFTGGEASWVETKSYLMTLNKVDRKKCLYACLVFLEKPPRLLILGLTRGDGLPTDALKSTSKIVDARIATFLPKLSDGRNVNEKETKNRSSWRPEFRMVNISMVKRIGLLYAQYGSSDVSIVKSFREIYGAKPDSSELVVPSKGKEATVSIKKAEFEKFRSMKKIWSSLEFDEVING